MAAAAAGRSGVNNKLCTFVHLIIFAWYVFTVWANCSLEISERHPGARTYGGRWKYLTFINLVMQTVFFGFCFLIDLIHAVLPSKNTRSGTPLFLVTVRDGFFTVLAFPVGTFVSTSFWSIYAYDRELVFPKFLDEIIPPWLNHALHTVILPLLLLQMYLQHHKYPSRSKAILILAVFVSLYMTWVFWVHHVTGKWVYPIMAHLSPVGLAVFLAAASISMAPLYLLGEKLNQLIWSASGEKVRTTVATATYTMIGETLRYVIPSHMQCSIGCGGRACKYEDPSRWSEDQQAIRGLYSSWITDSLLAMARPSSEIIENYNVIEQFQRCGLKTVINLQRPGEHASCGNPLEPESGFTYLPETFMEAGIYFYNFGWNDYGVASLTTILDMVKVMSFAFQEGKMAVHCHAGLGRTGVLIACFLVFTSRMTADQAILFVRSKRHNSIQTRGQLTCVRQFAKFLVPLRNLFANAEPKASPVTLSQYLIRQKKLLHGYEARRLRYVPKLVPLICKLLLDIAENRQVIEEDIVSVPDVTSDEESSISYNPMPLVRGHIIAGGVTIQPRLPGLPISPKDGPLPPLHYARKSLSYSDSDLYRLAEKLNLSGNPLAILASLTPSNASGKTAPQSIAQHGTLRELATYGSCSNIWELKSLKDKNEGCPLLNARRMSVLQRSKSLGITDHLNKISTMLRTHKLETEQGGHRRHTNNQMNQTKDEEEEQFSEVPFITIQSELTLEARRLLVAQSLAVDLSQDGKEEHIQKVSAWKTDLNYQGGWERLCLEQDPFVLTGILWSWLEQLKEPVLSAQDVQALKEPNPDPKTALNTLDRASKETLVCILECFAHLLVIPEEVENAFVERTIKAFTKMKNEGGGQAMYEIMTDILKRVLRDMRTTAMEETPQQ